MWYLHKVEKLTSKKYEKRYNLPCAGNKVFVNIKLKGGYPQTPLAYALE